MGSQIAVLPPEVIDQIAAGEVIERPASVVKELVDNAIDAGARTITVETQAGGRTLIRVSDDGCGMSAEDAVLALERHATSKLRQVDDLWDLATMGFRGEALPSIASVSRMTLTTRRQADLAATRVVVETSRLVEVVETGAPVGTTVEVVDLLANLPARLKFLKGEATEASHITELVARVAMAHPHLHLRLKHNGRTALEVPPDRDGFARAQALLGARVAARLVEAAGEEAGVRVHAYLAAPELAQATARGVQLFVGKRPIRDRGLLHAIAMGYGELVPRGRYPIAIVHLELPAGAVDFNVHPQKQEVRFADAAAVAAAVRHVVQAGVAAAAWRLELGGAGPIQLSALTTAAPPKLPFDGKAATPLSQRYAEQLRERAAQGRLFETRAEPAPAPASDTSPRAWAARIQHEVRAARAAEAHEQREARDARSARAAREARPERAHVPGAEPASSAELAPSAEPAPHGDREMPPEPVPSSTPAPAASASAPRPELAASPVPGFFATLRYLGQLDLTYLVCDGDGELVLVDQHAAHERVELERLRARVSERDVTVQKLLFPTTIEVPPAQLAIASDASAVLARAGFEVEVFGKSTLAIKAVPALRHGDPAQLLRTLLAAWVDDGVPDEDDRLERMLAAIACHSVVRAGDRLTPSEAEALLRGLDAVPHPDRGPHGRPVLLRLPLAEISRRFGR